MTTPERPFYPKYYIFLIIISGTVEKENMSSLNMTSVPVRRELPHYLVTSSASSCPVGNGLFEGCLDLAFLSHLRLLESPL